MLLCDAGKAVEFNVYVDSLKVGDFVMCHDYAKDIEAFQKMRNNGIWNWWECNFSELKEGIMHNNIIEINYFNDVAWFCGVKEEKNLDK